MIFNLNLPFKKLANDTPTNKDLTITIIKACVSYKYKAKEMNRKESRDWGLILDKFDEEGIQEIELEKSEFLFIRDTVDKTDLPPQFSSWLWTVRDYLDSLDKKDEKKLESVK